MTANARAAPSAELAGKVALVTGSTRGIGCGIAHALARVGASVVVTGRDRDAAERVAAELPGEAIGMALDVRSSAEVDAVVGATLELRGRIDILVNNAGIDRDAFITRVTDELWRDVIDTNLSGAFWALRAVTGPMKAAGSGVILNVLSWSGLRGNPAQAAYASSKAGLLGLTLTAAKELGRFGIRVNGLAPSAETDMVTATIPPERYAEYTDRRPLGRAWGTLDEVADGALFLVSDRSSYVTGQVLNIDGGLHLH